MQFTLIRSETKLGNFKRVAARTTSDVSSITEVTTGERPVFWVHNPAIPLVGIRFNETFADWADPILDQAQFDQKVPIISISDSPYWKPARWGSVPVGLFL